MLLTLLACVRRRPLPHATCTSVIARERLCINQPGYLQTQKQASTHTAAQHTWNELSS